MINNKNLDYNRISGNCRKVYDNYSLSTYKFYKHYHERDFRRIMDYLVSVIPMELQRREYDKIIPLIEGMHYSAFKILIDMAKDDRLDILCRLLTVCFRRDSNYSYNYDDF